jgi:phage portal protein BeeE
MVGTSFLDRTLSETDSRVDSWRRAARKATEIDNPIIATAGGVNQTLGYGQTQAKHAEQFRHYVGWVQVAVDCVAKRLAKQPIRAGRVLSDAAPLKSQRVLKTGTLQWDRLPTRVKAIGADVELMDDYYLLRALKTPNPAMVSWTLQFITAAALEIAGRTYWWFPVESGQQRIWPLPAHWVTPIHSGDELYVAYKIKPPGSMAKEWVVSGEQMAYFYLPDPHDPMGASSPVQAQGPAIATDEAIQVSQYRGFKNGMFPGMVIEMGRFPNVDGTPGGERMQLAGDQRQDLVEAIRSIYEGAVNFNEPLILDTLIEKVWPFTNKPREMDYLKSGESTKSRIFQAMGVNPIIAGEITGVNRAQAAVADELFVANVINPLGELIGQVLTDRERRVGYEDVQLWVEEATAHDPEHRFQTWSFARTKGDVSADEYRQHILGLPPQTEEQRQDDQGETDNEEDDESEENAAKGLPPPCACGAKSSGAPRPRRLQEVLWVRQVDAHEALLESELRRFFKQQAAVVLRELARVADESPLLFSSPNARHAAEQIADTIFRPVDWDEPLRQAVRRPLAETVIAGYLGARAGRAKGAKVVGDDWDYATSWEVPPHVRREVFSYMDESMVQPYWDSANSRRSSINGTRRVTLRGIVERDIDRGANPGRMAKDIAREFGTDRKHARTIARTEVGGALGEGHLIEAKELEGAGVSVEKTWFSVGDMDVREAHLMADGQTVRGADGLFLLYSEDGGEYKTPTPKHISLPAGLRINCRCGFHTTPIEGGGASGGEAAEETTAVSEETLSQAASDEVFDKKYNAKFVAGEPLTNEERLFMHAQFAKVPKGVFGELKEASIPVDMVKGGGVTSHPDRRHLRGVVPRGWENTKHTWDAVPGAGSKGLGDPVVLVVNKLPQDNGSINVAIHEIAHAFDNAAGYHGRSLHVTWQAIWQAVKWDCVYESTYAAEAFAESFAKYFHSAATRKALPSKVQRFFRELMETIDA